MAVTRGKPMQEGEDQRRARGFKPGKSGNPGGRPKELKAVIEMARGMTEECILGLMEIARTGQSEVARISAYNSVLDRAIGKPKQSVVTEDEDGNQKPLGIAVVFVNPDEQG